MKTKVAAAPAKLAAMKRVLGRATQGRGAALARFAQLRVALLGSINAGHWTAGERLPTEAELVTATGFSLGTVQRALRALTDEGVVRRLQGSGSFVAPTHHRIDDVAHCRFLGDDGKSFLPVFSKVLSRRLWKRHGPWSRHFNGAGARVVRLDRVLSVNGEFDVYSRFFFDGQRFKGLASRPIGELSGTNFKVLLRQESGVPVGGLSQSMQLVGAPADIAAHIGVGAGENVALLEIVRHAGGGHDVVYYQQMFIPPSARKLVTHPMT
jgi:GntR family transcriptional regulator